MPETRHRRSLSRSSASSPPPPSPTLPTQVFHPLVLPHAVPTPALVESVAGGAHYAGVKVDGETLVKHRRSSSHKNHAELQQEHRRILEDLTELYCCRPTLEIFERSWHKDAVFEDPLCKCKGFHEYIAQWFALPVFLSHAEQVSKRVMSSTHSPNQLIFHQIQEYTTRFFKRKKVIESIIVVDLDEDDKIIRLLDQWGGEEPPTRYGASLLRTLNAKIMPWFINIPKPSH